MKTRLPILITLTMVISMMGCDSDKIVDEKLDVVKDVEPPVVGIVLADSLKTAGESAGKLFGAAISQGVINSEESAYLDILENEFDYVTPENIAKWGSLQPENSASWQFEALDSMLALSQENQQKFKGHALVWHRQAPNFVNDSLSAGDLSALIKSHIDTTLERYKGKMYAWDVVNEAIGDDAQMRDSVFYRVLGEGYIAQAFIDAKAADPDTKLFYNDYGIAGQNAKSDAVFQMVQGLLDADVPIDGVGFQMHLEASSAPTLEDMVANLTRFTALGLSVNISEIDIRIASLPWKQPIKLAIQQQIYHRAVSACMQVTGCESITTWGFTDKYTWVDGEFGDDDPLLYDENYQQKPAYFGVADALLNIAPDETGAMPNLVDNGNVEVNLKGWSVWSGELSRTGEFAKNGKAAVQASARAETNQGPVYEITGLLEKEQQYQASVYVQLTEGTDEPTTFNAMIECESGEQHFSNLEEGTSQSSEWTAFSGEFITPNCEMVKAELYIDGPQISADIIVDVLTLRPMELIPDSEGYGENIITNSDLELGVEGWYGFGDPVIERTNIEPYSGEFSGVATNRLDTWQGAAYGVGDIIESGSNFQLFAWVKLSEGSEQIRSTLKLACPGGDQYVGIAGVNGNSIDWQLIAGNFDVPNCAFTQAELYFEGPSAGIDILFDDVTLHKKETQNQANMPLLTSDFEEGLGGWVAWGDALINVYGEDASEGNQSAIVTNRTGTWQGPVFDVLTLAVAGQSLDINVMGKIIGGETDTLQATFKTMCAGASEEYAQAGSVTVNDQEWSNLSGTFTLPDCTLEDASLYFDGPAIGIDILIDQVSLTSEQVIDPNNLISNGNFEDGIEGWVAWGDASIISTDEFAYDGMKSLKVQNRTANWQSAVYDLLPVIVAEQRYSISLHSRIEGITNADLSITLKTKCDGEAEVYSGAATAQVTDSDWSLISGEFTAPSCVLTEAFIYFDGPDAGIDIYLDAIEMMLEE